MALNANIFSTTAQGFSVYNGTSLLDSGAAGTTKPYHLINSSKTWTTSPVISAGYIVQEHDNK